MTTRFRDYHNMTQLHLGFSSIDTKSIHMLRERSKGAAGCCRSAGKAPARRRLAWKAPLCSDAMLLPCRYTLGILRNLGCAANDVSRCASKHPLPTCLTCAGSTRIYKPVTLLHTASRLGDHAVTSPR